jgi:hypothetical protein
MGFVVRRASVGLAVVLALSGAARGAHAEEPAAPSPPPPPSTDPVATSGTDLLPASAPAAGAAPASADVAALQARLDQVEARLRAAERAQKSAGKPAEAHWYDRLRITGFVQPQLVWQSTNTAGSPNLVNGALPSGVTANQTTALADGTTTNPDTFRLRRARLKTELAPTDYARLIFEIDPTPPLAGPRSFGGFGTLMRQVEAQGITRLTDDVTVVWGAGIFRLPFGYETQQSDADRPFIEHSWGEQNMMPGEYDTGAHADLTMLKNRFHLTYALVNGVMEGEPSFTVVPDLNKGKDSVGRIAYDFGPADVGVSGYAGQGQAVDPSALRFKNFRRDAFDVEAGFHQRLVKALGWTRASGELVFGTNMDRGVMYGSTALPAIPTPIGADVESVHERSSWIRVEQDFSHWTTLGLRYDFYTPNSALKNDGRDTYGVVGVVHFTRGLQLMAEYDYAIDNVHPGGTVAPSRHINTGSGVLQARF